jgi:hypothetical protein
MHVDVAEADEVALCVERGVWVLDAVPMLARLAGPTPEADVL